jgi:uncharacterized protein (AIM24 family)
MDQQLLGAPLPVLSISLQPGESVVAEAGEFAWMTDSIQMSTGERAPGPPPSLSSYTATGGPGTVAFAARFPGRIVPVEVTPGREYVVHQRGFLAGTAGIRLGQDLRQSVPAGIFAAAGFILSRIGGRGRAWVELAGDVIRFELGAGRSLRAQLGHVGMLEAAVICQVVPVDGRDDQHFAQHFAVLSGPGTVWLQSMPLPVLAAAITPYLGPATPDGPATAPVTNAQNEAKK